MTHPRESDFLVQRARETLPVDVYTQKLGDNWAAWLRIQHGGETMIGWSNDPVRAMTQAQDVLRDLQHEVHIKMKQLQNAVANTETNQ